MSVLLVENDMNTRLAMRWLLDDAGFVVTEAGSVAEGIAAVAGQRIALLDLDLPDGPWGLKLLLHIRRQSCATRVAFITATGDTKGLHKLLADADAVFKKPANFDAILGWMNVGTPLLNSATHAVKEPP